VVTSEMSAAKAGGREEFPAVMPGGRRTETISWSSDIGLLRAGEVRP
jgi:hypothetical protein